MKSWRKMLKFIRLLLRHGIFFAYWGLYDMALTAYTRLTKTDYIGIYVKTISPSEIALVFDAEDVGWAYVGYTLIKIGFDTKWFTEDCVVDLLTHEVLHQVLRARISGESNEKLDNIHKSINNSFDNGHLKLWKIDFIKR